MRVVVVCLIVTLASVLNKKPALRAGFLLSGFGEVRRLLRKIVVFGDKIVTKPYNEQNRLKYVSANREGQF